MNLGINFITGKLYALLVLSLLSLPAIAQISASGVPIDDDGILSIKQKPFDVNGFLIGRDFHANKFNDQDKGLKGMADCYFNISDASDAKKQNFSLCKKLGLGVVISAEGNHLVGGDWMKMSDQEIDEYVKKMVESGGRKKSHYRLPYLRRTLFYCFSQVSGRCGCCS